MWQDLTSEAEKSTFQDVFNEVCIVLDPVSVLPVQYEITNCMLPVSQGEVPWSVSLPQVVFSACLLTVGPFSLQILNFTLWTAPACHTAPLEIVSSLVCFTNYSEGLYMLTLCFSLLSPLVGSNYLKPLHEPMSKMLHMLQECSQLELALRVLLNSQGSCLQHITSNMMDMNLSMQVQQPHQCRRIAVCLLSWQFFTLFSFSSMRNECWWIIMCLWTKSRRTPAGLWTLWLWHYYKRLVKIGCCVSFSFFWFVCF